MNTTRQLNLSCSIVITLSLFDGYLINGIYGNMKIESSQAVIFVSQD